jgi:hypothetical protein
MTDQIEMKHIIINEISITCYCAGDGNDMIVLWRRCGFMHFQLSQYKSKY